MLETYMGPTANYAGSNSERQSVGLPGHCVKCAQHGHILAHPDLGCGDVGCNRAHDEQPPTPVPAPAQTARAIQPGETTTQFSMRLALSEAWSHGHDTACQHNAPCPKHPNPYADNRVTA